MFKSCFTTAYRNLLKHRTYFLINFIGLIMAITVSIFIGMEILYELSYDRYHEHADQIYRITEKIHLGERGMNTALTPPALGPLLKKDYPEVLNVARFSISERQIVRYKEKSFYEKNFFWADSSVFDVFSFSFVHGSPEDALRAPWTMVLTETMAQKYFGAENPLGKTLTVSGDKYTIRGVLQDIPANSHLRFDFLASLTTLNVIAGNWESDWLGHQYYTYLRLKENTSPLELKRKLPDFIDRYAAKQLDAFEIKIYPELQPLKKIHLYSHLEGEVGVNGSVQSLYLLSVIAILLLTLSGINFVNLATARALTRSKEVGLRKILGAHRIQIFQQFLGEAFLTVIAALIIGLILVQLMLPQFNDLLEKNFRLNFFDWQLWLILGGITIFIALVSGGYPAFFLSSFTISDILKHKNPLNLKMYWIRKILVAFQLAISVGLVVATMVVSNQLKYMQNKPLGFEGKQVVSIQIPRELQPKYEMIRNTFGEIPGVLGAAGCNALPGEELPHYKFMPGEQAALKRLGIYINYVDYDYLKVLGIELLEGRDFSRESGADKSGAYILNQAAVNRIGWKSPIGQPLEMALVNQKNEIGTVIGVVDDFHFRPLYERIKPLILMIAPEKYQYIAVKMAAEHQSETLQNLQEKWAQLAPDKPFDYSFLRQDFDQHHRSSQQLEWVVIGFTVLAIGIAALGLFALSAFMVEQRAREIALRKILGATTSGIVLSLGKEFGKWVLWTNGFAWPISWYVMEHWLQNFAYRAPIEYHSFFLAGFLTLIITMVTVGFQAIRIALLNPIETLCHE